MKVLFILSFSFVLLFSCKNEVLDPSNISMIEKCRNYTVDPCNSNNPYDTIGIIHNEAMDILADTCLLAYNTGEGFFRDQFSSVLMSHGLDESVFIDNFDSLKSWHSILMQYSYDYNDYYTYLNNNNYVTNEVKFYLDTLSKIVDSISVFLNINHDPTQTCISIINRIKSFESDVMNSSLTYNEQAIVLSSSSVGRHSICNYLDCINGADTRWDEMLVSRYGDTLDIKVDDIQTKLWVVIGADWEAVGKADIAGAVGGLAGGLVTGWITGILTPIVVAAATSAGAVANSVTTLANQILEGKAILVYFPFL